MLEWAARTGMHRHSGREALRPDAFVVNLVPVPLEPTVNHPLNPIHTFSLHTLLHTHPHKSSPSTAGSERMSMPCVKAAWMPLWPTVCLLPLNRPRACIHTSPLHTLNLTPLSLRSWQREDVDALREGGLDALRPDAFVVNGQLTQHNPWAASGTDAFIHYKEVQAKKAAERKAAEVAAAGVDGGSSGTSSKK